MKNTFYGNKIGPKIYIQRINPVIPPIKPDTIKVFLCVVGINLKNTIDNIMVTIYQFTHDKKTVNKL